MPCYHPLQGYRAEKLNPSGKRSIVFNVREGFKDLPVELPCNQCIGCRLDRSRKWAIRCVHEASLHSQNSFITLTYSQSNIPKFNTLYLPHFQKFLKRLRKKISPQKLRFFHCGEYGEKFDRPHYHSLIFGYDFPDKVQISSNQNGDKVYHSRILEDLWGLGFVTTGAVTYKSAAYVARYITKKITGRNAEAHYATLDEENGEWFDRKPEYTTMSRRPGIGRGWFDKYKRDLFPDDFVVMEGKKFPVPSFYSHLFENFHPDKYKWVRARRQNAAKKAAPDNTFPRLRVREELKILQFDQLKRSYEVR